MKFVAGDVAVITGGASGIGLAIARALGRRSVRIVIADIDRPVLEEATALLRSEGAEFVAATADVTVADSLQSLHATAFEAFGRVDMLFNNAGVGGVLGPMWDMDPKDWRWSVGVNLEGVANGIRAFVPGMIARRRGHVINTASLAGLTSPPFLGPYVATKHAVVGMTETLAAEFAAMRLPLTASVLCPGLVASRILTSERNRPVELHAASRTDPALLARLRAAFAAQAGEPMDSAEFASRVLSGVEADRLHIVTHDDSWPLVRLRVDALLGQPA